MPSFTTQVPNLQDVGPVVEVRLVIGSKIEEILRRNKESVRTPVQALAMIDTGATGTVVRADLVEVLSSNLLELH